MGDGVDTVGLGSMDGRWQVSLGNGGGKLLGYSLPQGTLMPEVRHSGTERGMQAACEHQPSLLIHGAFSMVLVSLGWPCIHGLLEQQKSLPHTISHYRYECWLLTRCCPA